MAREAGGSDDRALDAGRDTAHFDHVHLSCVCGDQVTGKSLWDPVASELQGPCESQA